MITLKELRQFEKWEVAQITGQTIREGNIEEIINLYNLLNSESGEDDIFCNELARLAETYNNSNQK